MTILLTNNNLGSKINLNNSNNNTDNKNIKINSIYVVLDSVRSAQNVGSFFRTCDSFNVEKIFLCGITSTPPNKEILKTALGATESVDWEYYEHITECLNFLKGKDYLICCVEQTENSLMLNDYELKDKKMCLVFGNEVEGVSQDIIDMADECIEIPQFGIKHSLNVSVAGGIVIWDIVSKMLQKK